MADVITTSKKWYTSKGVWTGIITIAIGAATGIAKLFGMDLNGNAIFGLVLSVLGAIGLYSRVTADTKIN
jgi:hypothetical protein